MTDSTLHTPSLLISSLCETRSVDTKKIYDRRKHTAQPPAAQRIPAEILIKIFTCSLPTTHEYTDTSLSKTTLADPSLVPFALASVCRAWRDTAVNTPELWDTCWLNYNHPEFNRIWLRRAGTRPLTLYGQCTSHTTSHRLPEKTSAFMESILPFRARWKVVRLNTRPFYGGLPLAPQSLPKAEVLEWMEIGGDDGIFEMPPLSGGLFSSFTSAAPLLRTLKLFKVATPILNHSMFPSLENLQIRSNTLHYALENLRNLSRLKTFSLITDYDSIDDLANLPHVIHENIQHLHFSCADPIHDLSFCAHITLPALSSLQIHGLGGPCLHTLVDMLDRSDCRITKLEISSSALSLGTLDYILSCDSVDYWVENLVFDKMQIHADFFKYLKYDANDPFLSYLEHLSFTGCNFSGFPDGLLADALDSRCRSVVYGYNDPDLGWVEKEVRLRSFFADSLPGVLFASDIPRIAPLEPGMRVDGPEAWIGKIIWEEEGNTSHTIMFSLQG